MLKADINDVFLNTAEFADVHTLNGREVRAVVNEDLFSETNIKFSGSAQQKGDGLFSSGITIYISTEDFGKPKTGALLEFDNKKYIVLSTAEQSGIYKITMQRTGGR